MTGTRPPVDESPLKSGLQDGLATIGELLAYKDSLVCTNP